MASREIITLQFGSFANHVGAHYWNFQDELLGLQEREDTRSVASQIDLSTMYRSGETLQGELTYTPRLVLCDLKGSLGGIGSRGTLYVEDALPTTHAGIPTWQGRAEVHRVQPVGKSTFMRQLEEEAEGEGEAEPSGAAEEAASSPLDTAARQLDSAGGVRYFTDYLKAHLHPRSIYQLEGVWQGVHEFGGFGDGGAGMGGGGGGAAEQREGMLDNIRFFAEECDSLAGFQCMADDLSGFGQLAADVLQELKDDYGGRTVMLFGVRPSAQPPASLTAAQQRRHALNNALSHAVLAQQCDTFTALAPPAAHAALPALNWQSGNVYHVAALCAAAVDAATLPFRLAGNLGSGGPIGGMDMRALAQLLTTQHDTPLTSLSLAMPCSPPPTSLQLLQQQGDGRAEHRVGAPSSPSRGPPFTSRMMACLTPGLVPTATATESYAESVVLRGARSWEGPLHLAEAAAALDAALAQEGVRCVRQRALVLQPLPIPLPYPHIFGAGVSLLGVPGAVARPGGVGVTSCPTLSRLAGTVAFKPAVLEVLRRFKSAAAAAQGQATLEGWGYLKEEIPELCERLANLAAAYEEQEL